MDDDIVTGMIMGVFLLALLFAVVGGICSLAGTYKDASHARLGSLGYACFANKTCRTDKPMRCMDNGSEAGICVIK